jgi:AcrR family transcriptional regulator
MTENSSPEKQAGAVPEKGKRKEDRRVARSRAALHQALQELVKEKGYEAVTVEDITERANLGRTTFYLHYRDKEDLFLEEFEISLGEMKDRMVNIRPREWVRANNGQMFQIMYQMVEKNADIFRDIIKEQSNTVYNRMREITSKIAQDMVSENPFIRKHANHISIPLDLVYSYFSGALWASIVWWVEHDFHPSAEEMNDNFRRMFFSGLFYFINPQNLEGLRRLLDGDDSGVIRPE